MEVISKTNRLKAVIRKTRCARQKISFVPTMGALHEGHMSLVRQARALGDVVVVSIFVNPTQFGPREDFDKYPRNLSHDVEMLSHLGVDYVFAPSAEEIYPNGFQFYVEVNDLSDKLCGASRPGHFRGVATVVAKLLAVVEPDYALFGQKDAQQLMIIRRLVQDLNFGVTIKGCPIIRESDGLALSSRNPYLSAAERAAATALYRGLTRAAARVIDGERQVAAIRRVIEDTLAEQPLARVDYIAIVNTRDLETTDTLSGEILIALAVYIGQTRLIDNLMLTVP